MDGEHHVENEEMNMHLQAASPLSESEDEQIRIDKCIITSGIHCNLYLSNVYGHTCKMI